MGGTLTALLVQERARNINSTKMHVKSLVYVQFYASLVLKLNSFYKVHLSNQSLFSWSTHFHL
jgi:hypothetical protein